MRVRDFILRVLKHGVEGVDAEKGIRVKEAGGNTHVVVSGVN
jgi:hypothetical protein